ncbi:MAG TPA: hypothetical protein VM166_00050 [Gemmatimonadaceae bacterium]|nr:hypothetical protein [Gemmatimonadaceae bacterium]
MYAYSECRPPPVVDAGDGGLSDPSLRVVHGGWAWPAHEILALAAARGEFVIFLDDEV